ncbi:MAG: glycine cleavage system protein GcvH [Anaerolineales bacterium]|nr:MAG: glycine cleavage system protein GcvH [Anaerolineales bacterium]
MKIDKDCRYVKTHEWVRVDGDEATVGITDHAQEQLSDIVYVELPEVGDVLEKGEVFATVESVKAAADVYMPIGGEITEINEELEDAPQLVNEDAFGVAWFARFTASDLSELAGLMDAEAYERFVAEEEAKGD